MKGAPLNCNKCSLCNTRTNVVNYRGNPDAKIIFIGEAPGEEEDKTGLPFQGRSGKLLDEAIAASGLKEEDYCITNVVKCRPPGNRNPNDEELQACLPYLLENIGTEKIIITVGRVSLEALIPKTKGTSFKIIFNISPLNFNTSKVYPMYHPAYILRNLSKKEEWINKLKGIINEI